MYKLYGFPVSNYVNMVHLALLEKGLPLEYVFTAGEQTDEYLAKSPRGKVPCLETPDGFLNEANVILEYLEDKGEGPPLLPVDAYQRALTRALMKEMEIYIELPARLGYPEVFFGSPVADAIKQKSRDELIAGFATLKRHGRFAPYVAGDQFSLADIVFLYTVSLGLVVADKLHGINPLADCPQALTLLGRLRERPHVQTLTKASDAAIGDFIAKTRARFESAKV